MKFLTDVVLILCGFIIAVQFAIYLHWAFWSAAHLESGQKFEYRYVWFWRVPFVKGKQ